MSKQSRMKGGVFERRVGFKLQKLVDELGWELFDHPWLVCGGRACQPDFVLVSPAGCQIVVECKLTECDCAGQMDKYRKALNGNPVIVLQVVRRVISKPTVDCFENMVDNGLMLLWI